MKRGLSKTRFIPSLHRRHSTPSAVRGLGQSAALCSEDLHHFISQTLHVIPHQLSRTYPQFRHANLSTRGSGQSRARCPTALQLTHLTSTRSCRARSSLQLRAMWPISVKSASSSSLFILKTRRKEKRKDAYHHSWNTSGSDDHTGDRRRQDESGSPRPTGASASAESPAAACG